MIALFFFLTCVGAFAGDLTLITVPAPHIEAHKNSPMAVSVVARSASGQDIQYEWMKDGKVLPKQKSNAITVASASKKDAGHYSVTVKTAQEAKTFDVHVMYNPKPLPQLKTRDPAAVAAEGPSHCAN